MRKHRDEPATLDDLHTEIVKVSRDITNARRQIDLLLARLRVAEDEDAAPARFSVSDFENLMSLHTERLKRDKTSELTIIRDLISALRIQMDDYFSDLRVIRAHIEAIANSAMPRTAIRKWLKDPDENKK